MNDVRQSQNGFYFGEASLHEPQRPAPEARGAVGRTPEQLGVTRWLRLSHAGTRQGDIYPETVP